MIYLFFCGVIDLVFWPIIFLPWDLVTTDFLVELTGFFVVFFALGVFLIGDLVSFLAETDD